MSEAEDALNKGLLAGYASNRTPGRKTRGGVEFRVAHPKMVGSTVYHDEWISGRTGGGQETIITDSGTFTRLYAGGVFPDEDLTQSGTNKSHVESALSRFLKGSEGKTRLREDYSAQEGDWRYNYTVTERIEQIGLAFGMERIELRGEAVFVHAIILLPVNK